MKWNDRAFVLSSAPYGEGSYLVKLFSETEGVFAGMVRCSRKNRAILEQGNLVQASWSARLEEHLGTMTLEMIEPFSAYLIQDSLKLKALGAITLTLLSLVPERDPHPELFRAIYQWMGELKHEENPENWLSSYVSLELILLKELGFALDLSSCADSGTDKNLTYVSPKSGRAVSKESGEPYHAKLLALPPFLTPEKARNKAKPAEILDGLRLTRYFLEQFACRAVGRELPYARREMEMFCVAVPA
ncbi:MAG: DNA repair protein RecO [Proteobacteria bacterium]|nr:DNA repair protein RecO [Pseudomonadota bacterium]